MSYAINFILRKRSQLIETGIFKEWIGADMRPEGKRPITSTNMI